ncbi:MAG: ribbon-helix-helix protein, CopG family [Nitriliruptorales bacterium]|nr:ribbon-helix-helix protein, CopG family [Nitriliruptorales bacterium]
MDEISVQLPDQLHALLRHEAERRGMSVSDLTREAIAHHLGTAGRRPDSGEPGHGGRHLAGERIEEALGVTRDDPDRHHVADNIEQARKAKRDAGD